MSPRIPTALLAALLLTACTAQRAHTRGPHPCPDPEARVEWLRIRSAHLELQTDLPVAEAEALARGLESAWEVQDRMLGPWRTDLPVRRTVLRGWKDLLQRPVFHDLRAREVALFGFPQVAPAEPDALEQGRHPVLASVAEQRLHAHGADLAPWIGSGLRDYLGALAPLRTGDVRVGRMLPEHLRALQGRAPYTHAQLRRQGDGQLERALVDASAWAWVHSLASAHPDRLVTLVRAATELRFEDAWALAFAGVDPGALDRAVQRHVAGMPYAPVRLRRAPATSTFELEVLTPADAHLAHAQLRAVQATESSSLENSGAAWSPDDPVAQLQAAARAEVEAALRLEPNDLHARVLREFLAERPDARALLALHARLREGEEAGAAGPDPDTTWVLLLEALGRAPAATRAMRAPVFLAAARRGRGSLVLATAASWLAPRGHAPVALAAAERAEALSPQSPSVQLALASALLASGRCKDARRTLEHAERSAGGTPQVHALRQHLDARCRAPATGVPPPRR